MTKSDLRRLYRQRRRDLPEADRQARCNAIEQSFFRWFTGQNFTNPVVHTFLPIEKQKEVNTWPIVRRLWQMPGVRIAASVTNPQDGTLTHYEIFPDTPFIPNPYGIPEPPDNSLFIIHYSLISLVLVPLLAFDQRGHRVGYGGGYYDRFLDQCRPDCVKMGLSLFEPVAKIDDVYEGDIRLDGCVTPGQFYSFPKN
ncbi:5-formyltetrahydrofolate cyclo-ligase [Tellurirhabdus rosea]|uniref:5-formyltetrahydrofolate cyclo-ligase n=1 Tax=Tellurirhabdus rosea TaxID=2674997 RepID=UPI00224CF23F|nr:5-formyltetrahydrofolate cyclo-ligase [Tellurirhabdus rosea]